ncbi:MAG: sugar ABC transporter permease [Clostridia bacterium]|nr:sugar ABC transporter permease [Clostridia bacterium]
MTNTNGLKLNKKAQTMDKGAKIFYAILMAFPVVQFVLFYIVVNFQSIGYAFMDSVESSDNKITWFFSIKKITDWFTDPYKVKDLLDTAKMSLLYYGVTLCVSIPLGLLFAYYVFKKMPFAGLFRIFLFIPSIIPAAASVLMFKYVLNEVTPILFGTNALRFDTNPLGNVIFYNLYVGFGTSVLMYANKMFDISPEVIEAGKLDGALGIKEFWHIVLPLTFPTLSVFLVTGVATIFVNQYNVLMFNVSAEYDPLGRYLYDLAFASTKSERNVPPAAALGLILTIIAIPLTFGVKYLLDKYGPSED